MLLVSASPDTFLFSNFDATQQPAVYSHAMSAERPWYKYNSDILMDFPFTGYPTLPSYSVSRYLGWKNYELTDHLGNVNVSVLDKISGTGTGLTGQYAYLNANISSLTDYFPFGMPMPSRSISHSKYRHGYNAHEKDDEVAGVENHMSFGGYGLDTRLARRWNIDPQWQRIPGQSPYSVNNNSPIAHTDPDGEFAQLAIQYGVNVGINIMTQMITSYMLDPNVKNWSDAWDAVSLWEAFGEGAVDMIGSKKLRMASNAVMDMASYADRVGLSNVTTQGMVTSGMIGLLEPIVGDAIAKHGSKAVVKGLLKMDIDASTIRKMTGGLSNKDVRQWYSDNVKNININLKPTEANARSVVDQRNSLKKKARDLMADRKAAADLNKTDPIQDFDYYYKKYDGDYQKIMQGGTKPNSAVNKKLGVQ